MKNTIKKFLALVCCLALSISSVAMAIPVAADGAYFNLTDDNHMLFVNVDQVINLEDVAVSLYDTEYTGDQIYWWPVDGEILIVYDSSYYGDLLVASKAGVYTVEIEDDDGTFYEEITIVVKNPEDENFVVDEEIIPAISLDANPDLYVPTELDPAMASYESQKIGVMSDVHIQVATTNADHALKAALTEMKEQGVSAVLFTGDTVNTGIAEEYEKFHSIWDEVMGDTDIQMLAIPGNHEFEGVYFRGEKYDDLLNDYLEAFGRDEANFHEDINGIHVIGLVSEGHKVEGSYTLETMMYLDEQLAIAKDEDPYAPILVLCHQPLPNTTYSSYWEESGAGSLYESLRYYPQVVFLSGHTHFDVTNDRSIMQKDFTCIDVPSMQYSNVEDGIDGNIVATYDYQNYLILEVDGDNKTLDVNRYKSYETDKANHTYEATKIKDAWSMELPLRKSTFTYTEDRANDRVAPTFGDGAAISVDKTTNNSATITFPAATHDDYVHAYQVDVTDASGSMLTSQYIVSDFYTLGNKKTSYTVDIEGIPCNTQCIVSVSAMESFGKFSAPLTAEFFTEPITTPSVAQNVADFFDVNIAVGFEDNSPYRRSYNLYAKSHPIQLVEDAELGQQVAYMGGWINYGTSLGSLKDIANHFSVEVAFKTPDNFDPQPKEDGTPGEKEGQTIFGNRENGGFALEFNKDDAFQASVFINGEEKIISAGALNPNTWYHAILTFDGENLVLYLDDNKVGEVAAPGLVTFDKTISHLSIGGDVSTNGTSARIFYGHVALARVYTSVLNVEDVVSAYGDRNLYNTLYEKWLALYNLDTTNMGETDVAKIYELMARAEALLGDANLTAFRAFQCVKEIHNLLNDLAVYNDKNALVLFNDQWDDYTKIMEKSETGLQWENNTEIKATLLSKNENIDIYVTYKLPGDIQYVELDALGVATECVIDGDFTIYLSKDGVTWVEQAYNCTEPVVNERSSYWMNSTLSTPKIALGEGYCYIKIQLNKFGMAYNEIEQKEIQRCNWSTVMDNVRIWYTEDASAFDVACTNHIYDNACDADCNDCGATRTAPHEYDDYQDAECNLCGHVREVSGLMAGDLNNDGKVNVRDLGVMQQYINNWEIEINLDAADVNGDGKINVRDLGLMQQYINGWDVELQLPN